jgi:hypothetical protein
MSIDFINTFVHDCGYDFVSKARLTGKGGGVAAYISDNITWIRRNDLEDEAIECIWLEIKLKHAKNVRIGIVYRPPDRSKHLCSNFNYAFSDMLLSVTADGKEALLLRDCNVNYLVKEHNASFKANLSLHGFKHIIKKPTRTTTITQSLIDIIATNATLTMTLGY